MLNAAMAGFTAGSCLLLAKPFDGFFTPVTCSTGHCPYSLEVGLVIACATYAHQVQIQPNGLLWLT